MKLPSLPFGRRSSEPRAPVLAGYRQPQRLRPRTLFAMALYAGVLIFFGGALTYFGPSALLPLMAPLSILVLLIIWAMPDSERPPTRWVSFLTFGFVIALLAWPDYLALALPGLPWITAIRLTGVPLAVVFLISLSVSKAFRAHMSETLRATPITTVLVLTFALIATVSLAFSADPTTSLNKLVVAYLYWFLIFFASAWLFSKEGNVYKLACIIWIFVMVTTVIGLQEWRLQSVVWAGHIPDFLRIEDPAVQNILSAKSRSTTGIYRVQSKFTTPLGFAEYLALSTPFILFFLIFGRRWFVRLAAAATLALIFLSIQRTDSRLGAVGFFMSFLLFLAAWSVLRWSRVKESIIGPALTLAYPAVFAAFIASTFFVGRIQAMVWGTKAQSFSSQAREAQVQRGMPLIWAEPWGRGIGRGARELNYRNLGGGLTIDTYYLLIGLEFGVLGFLVYFGMFLSSAGYGAKNLFAYRTREHLLLIPLIISVLNFVIVKSVFAQQENHPLMFMFLGAITALCWQIQRANQPIKAPQVAD
ncbi:O-antigen ligase family protein [Erythrobacter sp. LQ02-29]|uniref:O-antigen ligase family protein n=1 Tax=Erythrobacter sp. LQ02-29 TaxID=2920384 RepID=UPI001F4E1670|nr:O-antigen ligase family protein [Erythrobacter sp. LQ02-29]MCP9222059.1 O-antigen ligase family protein [Erythrobacter sp. LQ02-29]